MDQLYQLVQQMYHAFAGEIHSKSGVIFAFTYLYFLILNPSGRKAPYRFLAPVNIIFAIAGFIWAVAGSALLTHYGSPFLKSAPAKSYLGIAALVLLSPVAAYGAYQLYVFFKQRYSTALVSPANTSSHSSASGRTAMSGELGRDPTDSKPLVQTLFEFGGSYIVLGFLLLLAAAGLLAFVSEQFPPALFGAVIWGGAAFGYWKWHQRPRTIVSATAPPIAPVAAPATGNMRVQMQRREVVRKQKTGGLSSVTFNTFELICQVQFSETALKTIQHAGLLSYVLHNGPKNFLDDDLSPILVRDFIGKPVSVIRESIPEIGQIETELRVGLTTLNDQIKSALQTPMTSSETFEL